MKMMNISTLCSCLIITLINIKAHTHTHTYTLSWSQVDRPVNYIEEKEGEREQSSSIEIDLFSSRRDDGFRRWRLLVVLALWFSGSICDLNGLAVTVEVWEFEISWEWTDNTEIIWAQIRFWSTHLLTAVFHNLHKHKPHKNNQIHTRKSICLSVHSSIHLSICPTVRLSVSLSLSVHLFIHPSIHPSISHPSSHLSLCYCVNLTKQRIS